MSFTLPTPLPLHLPPRYAAADVRAATARRAISAGDPLQHRQRWPHLRGGGRQALARAPLGLSAGRLLSAPRGPRLLGAPGLGSRRRLAGADDASASPAAVAVHEDRREALHGGCLSATRRAGLRERVAGPARLAV